MMWLAEDVRHPAHLDRLDPHGHPSGERGLFRARRTADKTFLTTWNAPWRHVPTKLRLKHLQKLHVHAGRLLCRLL